jgi:hypothetical protein
MVAVVVSGAIAATDSCTVSPIEKADFGPSKTPSINTPKPFLMFEASSTSIRRLSGPDLWW